MFSDTHFHFEHTIQHTEVNGVDILVGGRFGRKIRIGDSLGRIFNQDEVVSVVDVILEYYIKNADKGERMSSLVDRIGKEKFIYDVLDIFDKKNTK